MSENAKIAAKPRWVDVDKAKWGKFAVIAVLFCILFWHNIVDMVFIWSRDSTWSHGFIIPLFSIYLINLRREAILSTPVKPSVIGLLAMVTFIGIYIFNIVQFRYAYGEPLLMLATMFAITLFLCGWKLMLHLWLPIAYLFFAIPIPSRLYREITVPLRHIAAQFATAFLNVIPHLEATARGVIIDVIYRGKPLETALDVADACSGMRLLMAFVALGVAMAYLHERPIWQKLVLLISTIPIAVLCNVIRVTITAKIHIFIGSEYASGIYHDLLGLLMLPLAFGFYWGISWFMEQLFIDDEELQDKGKPKQRKVIRKGARV